MDDTTHTTALDGDTPHDPRVTIRLVCKEIGYEAVEALICDLLNRRNASVDAEGDVWVSGAGGGGNWLGECATETLAMAILERRKAEGMGPLA